MAESFKPIRKSERGDIVYTSDTLNFGSVETAGFLLREVTTKEKKKHFVKHYIIASVNRLSLMQDILDSEIFHIKKEKISAVDQIDTSYTLSSDKSSPQEWTYMFRLRIDQKKLTLVARNSEEHFLWLVTLHRLLNVKIKPQNYSPPQDVR